MMTEEQSQLMQRIAEACVEEVDGGETQAQKKNDVIKAPAQEEMLMDEELRAIRSMFTLLEPMSVRARIRCVQYVV